MKHLTEDQIVDLVDGNLLNMGGSKDGKEGTGQIINDIDDSEFIGESLDIYGNNITFDE